MLEYNDEVLAILRPRLPDWALEGYYGGLLSPDGTKLVAYTWQPIDTKAPNISHFLQLRALGDGGHVSTGTTEEDVWFYDDDGSYQRKGMERCLEDGVFHSYSLEMIAAQHEGNWYIGCGLSFFGSQMDEGGAKRHNARGTADADFFEKGLFAPYRTSTSSGERVRNVSYEEFGDLPWIISLVKVEEKEKVHRAFTTYMNLAFVKPLFERLRIRYPEEYVKFCYRYSEDYTLIFPEHKKYFLVVTLAENERLGYRLAWFFFDTATETFYRWKYPQARYGDQHDYTPDIIEDIKDISSWDNRQFLGSTRTLDDSRFWQEYVLKKEDGAYVWLEPMAVGGGKASSDN